MSTNRNLSLIKGDTFSVVFQHSISLAGYSASFVLTTIAGTEVFTGSSGGGSPALVISGQNVTLTIPSATTTNFVESGNYYLRVTSAGGVVSTTFQGFITLDLPGGEAVDSGSDTVATPIADFDGVAMLDTEQSWTAPQHFSEGISTTSIGPDGESSTITIGQVGGSVSITGLTGSGGNLTNIPAGQLQGTVPASLVHTSPLIVRYGAGTPNVDEIQISTVGNNAIFTNRNGTGGSNAGFTFSGTASVASCFMDACECQSVSANTAVNCTGSINAGVAVTGANITAAEYVESPLYSYDGNCEINATDDLTLVSDNGSVVVGNRMVLHRSIVTVPEDTPIQLVAGNGPVIAPADTEFSSGTVQTPSDPVAGMTYFITNVRESGFSMSVVDHVSNPIGVLAEGYLGILIYNGTTWNMWAMEKAPV